MRSSRKGWLAALLPGGIYRPIVPCLLLVVLAGPAGVGLEAKDKEARRVRREQKQKEREQGGSTAPDAAKDTPREPAPVPAAQDTVAIEPAKAPEPSKTPDPAKTPDKQKVAHKAEDTARLGAGDARVARALAPALEAARSSRDTLRKLPGYTCTFIKQEQIKKNALTRQVMTLKFRREPFSVYLKFIEPNPGREVLYVEGRNDGKFHFREASGLLSYMGTMSLLPTSNDAMKENRYPITMIGMEKMLGVFISEWEESLKHPDSVVQHFPQAKFGEIDCQMFEVSHPQQRDPLKFHKGRVYFDKKTNLPIRSEQYAFPTKAGREPQLVEEYNYLDVKAVDSPSEKDFDVKNESYGFR